MNTLRYDCAVIGGGAAGMTAAIELSRLGRKTVVIERDALPGGILNQCIHNGFGLHWFKEELSGPEYAERLAQELSGHDIDLRLSMTVTEIKFLTVDDSGANIKRVLASSSGTGVMQFDVEVIILAMGCRERNRGNIGIPGTRPAGVFTAGLAQRLINIEGYIPGKRCVIVGSGDIGLIMARRMTWVGARVEAVVEIQPYAAGLTRNIVQCLNDFDIPLYLSHEVTEIYGKDRVEGVKIAPLEGGTSMDIPCDTVLLSVGLVPDTELIRGAGMELRPETSGPEVNEDLMCSMPGVFACGNVLHVHDLVDWVSEEAQRAARAADRWMARAALKSAEIPVKAGSNLRYVLPHSYSVSESRRFSMRSMIVSNAAVLEIRRGKEVLQTKKLRHIQPSEMIHIDADPEAWPKGASKLSAGLPLEFHLTPRSESDKGGTV